MMKINIKKYGFAPVLFLFALLSFQVKASDYAKTKKKVRNETESAMNKSENYNKSCSKIATEVIEKLQSKWFVPEGLDEVGYDTAYNHCVNIRNEDAWDDYM